jgi:hypothetical protein
MKDTMSSEPKSAQVIHWVWQIGSIAKRLNEAPGAPMLARLTDDFGEPFSWLCLEGHDPLERERAVN